MRIYSIKPGTLAKVQSETKREDYYAILGISRDTTNAQIKKAYHAKAMLFHPNSSTVIKAIAADPAKTEYYDNEFNKICQAYQKIINERQNSEDKIESRQIPSLTYTVEKAKSIFEKVNFNPDKSPYIKWKEKLN
ncbi:MAG: DnaJ domain-containing protein [Gammaproteobacteria bacterium]